MQFPSPLLGESSCSPSMAILLNRRFVNSSLQICLHACYFLWLDYASMVPWHFRKPLNPQSPIQHFCHQENSCQFIYFFFIFHFGLVNIPTVMVPQGRPKISFPINLWVPGGNEHVLSSRPITVWQKWYSLNIGGIILNGVVRVFQRNRADRIYT